MGIKGFKKDSCFSSVFLLSALVLASCAEVPGGSNEDNSNDDNSGGSEAVTAEVNVPSALAFNGLSLSLSDGDSFALFGSCDSSSVATIGLTIGATSSETNCTDDEWSAVVDFSSESVGALAVQIDTKDSGGATLSSTVRSLTLKDTCASDSNGSDNFSGGEQQWRPVCDLFRGRV